MNGMEIIAFAILNGEEVSFLVFIRKTKVVLYYEKRNMMQMNDASMSLVRVASLCHLNFVVIPYLGLYHIFRDSFL